MIVTACRTGGSQASASTGSSPASPLPQPRVVLSCQERRGSFPQGLRGPREANRSLRGEALGVTVTRC